MLLAILAMEASWLPDLQRPNRLGPLHHVNHYLDAIGLAWQDLPARYGATAFEWQPFGEGVNVIELAEGLRVRTRATLGPNQFHWRPMDLLQEFLALPDEAALKRKMEELSSQPSVVVVDPISLYHEDVKTVFLRLSEYVSRQQRDRRFVFAGASAGRRDTLRRAEAARVATAGSLVRAFDSSDRPPSQNAALTSILWRSSSGWCAAASGCWPPNGASPKRGAQRAGVTSDLHVLFV